MMKMTSTELIRERRKGVFKENFWVIAVSGGLTAILLLFAFCDVRNSQATAREVEARIAHIRTATASDLAGDSPNSEVVVQGRISPLAPAKHGSYAAYVEICNEYEDGGPTVDIRPPLPLETDRGNISVENYTLDDPATQKDGKPLYFYSAIKPGQVVVVGGYIQRGASGPAFHGAAVLDPKCSSYASFLRDSSGVSSPVEDVILYVPAALFFLGIGGVLVRLNIAEYRNDVQLLIAEYRGDVRT